MLDAALLDECRRLAFDVAPELSGSPLHVVSSDVFDGTTIRRDCLGWSLPTALDFALTDRIPGWSKPGPVVCLFAAEIRDTYGPEHFFTGTLATMLHETAHLVPIPADTWQDRPAEFDCTEVRALLARKTAEGLEKPIPSDLAPDAHHGIAFVRTVTHLYARSRLAGWDLPHNGLYGGSLFLPQLPHFLAALLPEVVAGLGKPFGEILDQDPPAAFTELWNSSIELYNSRFQRG